MLGLLWFLLIGDIFLAIWIAASLAVFTLLRIKDQKYLASVLDANRSPGYFILNWPTILKDWEEPK